MALMMSISLRFIPTLMQETDKIMKAQMARGVEFASGPLKERIKALFRCLFPCLSVPLNGRRSLRLQWKQEAIVAGKDRTKYRQLSWQIADSLQLVLLAIINDSIILITFIMERNDAKL